jgi:hypothetical protein
MKKRLFNKLLKAAFFGSIITVPMTLAACGQKQDGLLPVKVTFQDSASSTKAFYLKASGGNRVTDSWASQKPYNESPFEFISDDTKPIETNYGTLIFGVSDFLVRNFKIMSNGLLYNGEASKKESKYYKFLKLLSNDNNVSNKGAAYALSQVTIGKLSVQEEVVIDDSGNKTNFINILISDIEISYSSYSSPGNSPFSSIQNIKKDAEANINTFKLADNKSIIITIADDKKDKDGSRVPLTTELNGYAITRAINNPRIGIVDEEATTQTEIKKQLSNLEKEINSLLAKRRDNKQVPSISIETFENYFKLN